eukprot:TRINITY_DN5130_c0_g1_i3.p1 TRINITY_DN5130_c0_g1~~TRINITY_DN5130_c0_g1_i3.p1  ORF type:complete len:308 (-),score=71.25 TRINITY_DN5130_c0_g1_i3:17-940(-)
MSSSVIRRIGVVSAGDMGSAVGRVLGQAGYSVVTCMVGRSLSTRRQAEKAGMRDTPSLSDFLAESDVVFSILPPSSALDFAKDIAKAASQTPRSTNPLFVDFNAIAPKKANKIHDILRGAGMDMVDGCIIGLPPRAVRAPQPCFYVSGPRASHVLSLGDALNIKQLNETIGAASNLKMCYSALSKGLAALGAVSYVTAETAGLLSPLREALQVTHPELDAHFQALLPAMCPKAYRWVGEMDEIASTQQDAGVPPGLFQGASKLFEFIAASPLGQPDPSTGGRTPPANMEAALRGLAEEAEKNAPKGQ